MSINALNPVLATAMAGPRKSAAESEAKPATTTEAPADTALTGSTTGQLSPDTKTLLLSLQSDHPAISLKSMRQTLFERYDGDKNGTIDDGEWQHYLDAAHKPIVNGQPLDFRTFDPATESKQVTPSTITLVPLDNVPPPVEA